MMEKPTATTKFGTDTATLAIFDPVCLRHLTDDDCDWWSIPEDETREINAGNVLFVSLGSDGVYDCSIFRDREEQEVSAPHVSAIIRTEIGSFYFGSGEEVPGDGIGPDTVYGGVLLALPAGNWKVKVYREKFEHLIVRLSPTEADAINSFDDSPRLD